jgi:cell division protein FtsN
MNHQTGDAGAQFVLDNRKLIVGFALLIVLCGTFFIIGFMEGKRQGIQRGKEQLPASAVNAPTTPIQAADSGEHDSDRGSKPVPEKSVREQLEWYKSVNKREEVPATPSSRPGKTAEPAGDSTSKSKEAKAAAPQAPSAKKPMSSHPSPATSSQKTTYTVQVGAFKHRREAETKAAALKAGGYEYFIEPSGAAEPLFLLKVGRFASRAEAVATQLKLKRDGFATFIKTNP